MKDKLIKMWISRNWRQARPTQVVLESSNFIEREFQIRYGMLVLGAAMLGMALTIFPVFYFVNQNYQIFSDLAYDQAPELLDSLERERLWVKSMLFANFVAVVFFFSFLSFKLTHRIVGPLKVLRNHVRRLSRGDWSQPKVRIRENDEFHDLIDSYNYFYESFRTQILQDLEHLRQIQVDENDRNSLSTLRDMIELKRQQIGAPLSSKEAQPISLISSNLSGSPDSRRVS